MATLAAPRPTTGRLGHGSWPTGATTREREAAGAGGARLRGTAVTVLSMATWRRPSHSPNILLEKWHPLPATAARLLAAAPFLWLLLARLGELRGAPWAEGFRFGPRVMAYAQSSWHDRRYRNRRFLDGPVFDLSVGSARRRRVVRSGRMSTAPSGIFAAREFRSDYGFGATACWCGAAPEGPATRPGPSMDTVVQPGNLKKALARVGRNVSGATRGHPASTA